MSRTANDERPEELRKEILRYLTEHGIADLSLRPLAKAVGSSPRVLLYYFGSKEKLVANLLSDLRRQQRAIYDRMTSPPEPGSGGVEIVSFEDTCRAIWLHMIASESEPYFRLFFEAYGLALRYPQRYEDFLRTSVEDWLEFVADPLRREGYELEEARAFATVVLAGFRGFMLDYCGSGDRKRLDRAVDLWLHALGSLPIVLAASDSPDTQRDGGLTP